MMKDEELVGLQRRLRVGLSFVVGEFNLVSAIEELDDGADLPTAKALRRQIRKESHYIKKPRCHGHCSCIYFTKQLVNRGVRSPRRTIHMLLTIPAPRGPLISNSST